MGILHECHGMSTEEAMMEGPKRIWIDRKVIYQFFPPNDEAVEYTRTDLSDALAEAADKMLDASQSQDPADWQEAYEELESALAAYRGER